MNVWAFIFKYLRKTKLMAAVLLTAIIIRAAAGRGEIFAMSRVIGTLPDYASDQTVIKKILFYIVLLGVFLVLKSLTAFTWEYVNGKFIPYFCSLIYKDIFVAVHHQSAHFFSEEMAGRITAKVKNIVRGMRDITGQITFGIIRPVTSISISLFLICCADLKTGLIVSALNLAFVAVNIFIRRKIGSYAERRAHFYSEADGAFTDTVTNSELVKSFAGYFYEKRRFCHILNTAVRSEQEERKKIARLSFTGNIIFQSVYLLSCICVFYGWYTGSLTLDNVVMSVTLLAGMIEDVVSIGYFAGEFSQNYGQVKDGLELIFSPSEVKDMPDAHNMKMRGRAICFDHITYHYDGKSNLFENFSLRIKSGEKVGLVGHSGSGKSTLIKLLTRYYDVSGGKITVGGEDIKKVRQESLRAHIAVIPQDTTLFNRTVMENIRYGRTDATDEEVVAAAKKAYADEFIRELPAGYESKVGERGVMLSGGERQRIAIARAVLKDAPVLILDEATSALDSESEMFIQKSLKKLMKGKTVIAIAHRLSTLKEMDRLVVMDKGKIVEEGSHDELLKRKGAYYRFYKMQSGK